MALAQFVAHSTGTAANTQSDDGNTTVSTLLTVEAPATQILDVGRPTISFAGTDSTAARKLVEIFRSTDDGTGTAVTPVAVRGTHGLSSRAVAANAHSVEPGGKVVIFRDYVPPNIPFSFPYVGELKPGESIGIQIAGSTATAYVCSIPYTE